MSYSKSPGQIAFERWHAEHRAYDGAPRYWKYLTIYERDVWENLPGAQRIAAALGDLKKENLEKMTDPPVFSGCDLASDPDRTVVSARPLGASGWYPIFSTEMQCRDHYRDDMEAAAARADEQAMIALIVNSYDYRKGMAVEAERLVAAYPDLFPPPETAEQIADRRSEHRWAAIGKPGGGLHPEDAKGYRAPVRHRLARERYVDDITAVLNKAARPGSHLLGAVHAIED